MEKVLQIRDLSVYFGTTCALQRVNLDVQDRDFMGVIGPNGGGKTTLLKTILGFVKPSQGSICFKGEERKKSGIKIGYVPQYTKIDRAFPIKAYDVVLMGLLDKKRLLLHFYSAKDHQAVGRIMKRIGIEALQDRQIGQLSGGELQKVLMARTLIDQPEILLLDEPTASMDSGSRTRIYELLREFNEEMTIIAVTHDMSFISSYIKTIACLNKELFYHGEPKVDEELIRQVYGCPIEMIAHGVPHRVLGRHGDDEDV